MSQEQSESETSLCHHDHQVPSCQMTELVFRQQFNQSDAGESDAGESVIASAYRSEDGESSSVGRECRVEGDTKLISMKNILKNTFH